jgi:hypothetical protein
VRVKLKIKSRQSGKTIITNALVNTGFETDTPDILIPTKLAKAIDLWPLPLNTATIELGTAGGLTRNYTIPDALEVEVISGDRKSEIISCNVIISPIEEEVLINDKLTGRMKIVIVDAGEGKWKFLDEPDHKIKKSESIQLW